MKKKRFTIGFLFDFLDGDYANQIFVNILKSCREYDINFIGFGGGTLKSKSYKYREQKNVIYDIVSKNNIDGIIIIAGAIGNFVSKNEIKELFLKFTGIPIVSIGIDIEGTSNIIMDNYKGMEKLIIHLIEHHKYKKIAFIKGAQNNYDAIQRFDAYKNILKKYNIPLDNNLIVNGDFDYFFGIEAVRILIDERNVNFDALVSANDEMAIYAMRELQKRGFRVPEDVCVTGFDNIELCLNTNPRLTTVKQSFYDISKISVKTILSILKGDKYKKKIILPTELIIRESCGCSEFQTLNNIMNYSASYEKKIKSYLMINNKKNAFSNLKDILKDLQPDLLNKTDVISNIDELYEIIFENMNNYDKDKLLKIFKKLFIILFEHNIEIFEIYNLVTIIFESLSKHSNYDKIKILWKEVVILIGLLSQNYNSAKRVQIKEESKVIFRINEEFINTFNTDQLRNVILSQLPKLPLKSFYLCLYDNKSRKTSKLLVYYNLENIYHIDLNTKSFPSKDLLPGRINKSKRFEYIVMALYFKEEHLGYILFEVNTMVGSIYETLATQISGSIKGAMLTEEINKYTYQLENKVKERTKKLEEANKRLKELDNLKNDFIANITHEFRSPLTAILNIADLSIKFGSIDEEDNKENYNIIYTASLRLKQSIDKLLELSKMDSKGIKLKIQKIKIKDFLNSILDFYSSSITGSNIKIIREMPEYEIKNFYSDKEKLEEIINNILSNAIKFVDQKNGQIIIKLKDQKNKIRIIISDNGIGIPKEKLKIIFNRFEQVIKTRNSHYTGTGIGLSFAKQLTGYLKGKIWAESDGLGKGSTFIVELKKGKNNFEKNDFYIEKTSDIKNDEMKMIINSEIQKKKENEGTVIYFTDLNGEDEYNYKKGKILIIDDDKNIRKILIKYLRKHSYKNLIEASDGMYALDAVYKYYPDLIICDYNMPKMKGNILHDKLLDNPNFKNIPFIFLSAIDNNKIIIESRLKGACEYLKKPIDEKILMINIEQHLKKYFEYQKISQLSKIDKLTGLNNEREILSSLKHELSARKYRDLSVVSIDLDHFKTINDTYGHQTGDKVLSSIGEIIKSSVRNYDIPGKVGGEKFIIILPETNLKNAITAAEILRKKIENNPIIHGEQILKITSSFGVASLIDNINYINDYLNIDDIKNLYEIKDAKNADWDKIEKYKIQIADILLKMADIALYKAKQTVCNKCGFNSENTELFKNKTCPECNSNDLIFGRNNVIGFDY